MNPAGLPSIGFAPTASDLIAKHIREAIVTGEFDEGEPIRQDDVAKLFDVSKIPVREALKRLEAEGLVEFQRNRGAVVKSVSEPEIEQIFIEIVRAAHDGKDASAGRRILQRVRT